MLADNDMIVKAEAQMNRCALALAELAIPVANAKQVKEYDAERRKRVLSIAVVVWLDLGESAAAAEHKARASNSYGDSLTSQAEQYQSALETIEKYEALKIKFESARSILSVEKAKIGLI